MWIGEEIATGNLFHISLISQAIVGLDEKNGGRVRVKRVSASYTRLSSRKIARLDVDRQRGRVRGFF